MSDSPPDTAGDPAGDDQSPRYIQHKWESANNDVLERVLHLKDERYNLSWKELLAFAALCAEQGDEAVIDERVGAAQRAVE